MLTTVVQERNWREGMEVIVVYETKDNFYIVPCKLLLFELFTVRMYQYGIWVVKIKHHHHPLLVLMFKLINVLERFMNELTTLKILYNSNSPRIESKLDKELHNNLSTKIKYLKIWVITDMEM